MGLVLVVRLDRSAQSLRKTAREREGGGGEGGNVEREARGGESVGKVVMRGRVAELVRDGEC